MALRVRVVVTIMGATVALIILGGIYMLDFINYVFIVLSCLKEEKYTFCDDK